MLREPNLFVLYACMVSEIMLPSKMVTFLTLEPVNTLGYIAEDMKLANRFNIPN